jgi:hypothetical protein
MSRIAFITWNGGGNLAPARAMRASFSGVATAVDQDRGAGRRSWRY